MVTLKVDITQDQYKLILSSGISVEAFLQYAITNELHRYQTKGSIPATWLPIHPPHM